MKKCLRVGINCTKRCNWQCVTCFYRYAPDFNTKYDKPLAEAMAEVRAAKARGCDHALLVGWGEPALWPCLNEWIAGCGALGMTTSMITNGSAQLDVYKKARAAGMNHLHISIHGINETLDAICGVKDAGSKQQRLLTWLMEEHWPWRMNMTVQQKNYKEMQQIAEMCLFYGCKHIISLGFLPLYEWNGPDKFHEVAVHPATLRPYIEKVAERVIKEKDVMFTIRYHPHCLLDRKYWKYIVNARYVHYDPWEWDYGHAGMDDATLWNEAQAFGRTQSQEGPPCCFCDMRMHCGGWNRVYMAGFAGAGIEPIKDGSISQVPGFYHDQNWANNEKGYFDE